jgi:hypothetical protein
MKHPDYFVALDSFAPQTTLKQFAKLICATPRKAVGTIQIAELCSMWDYPNGVYLLFHSSGPLWYVGKSSSRSFIERVPSHFDPRENAWFNNLPKLIVKVGEAANFRDGHSAGLLLNAVLIGAKACAITSKLESDLRSLLQPHLNAARPGRVTGAETLQRYDI